MSPLIACLHFAAFVAALEQRDAPVLASQPLLVVAPERVYACCVQAAALGVEPGMALTTARSRCPSAGLVPARPSFYRQEQTLIEETLLAFADSIEVTGEVQGLSYFLALPPLTWDEATAVVQEVGAQVREATGLAPALGLADGKFPAQRAAESVAPHHLRRVPQGTEATFLADHAIDTLPLPAELLRRLRLLGISTLKEFAALPAGAVFRYWGNVGREAHRLAQGRDARPLRPRPPQPALQLSYQCEEPLSHRAPLQRLVAQLAAQLQWELAKARQQAGALWLRVCLEDGSTRERRRTLPKPVREGLEGHYEQLLEQLWLPAGVEALTLKATGLVPLGGGTQQISLWEELPSPTAFSELLPYLRARYGTDCFLTIEDSDTTSGSHFVPLRDP